MRVLNILFGMSKTRTAFLRAKPLIPGASPVFHAIPRYVGGKTEVKKIRSEPRKQGLLDRLAYINRELKNHPERTYEGEIQNQMRDSR